MLTASRILEFRRGSLLSPSVPGKPSHLTILRALSKVTVQGRAVVTLFKCFGALAESGFGSFLSQPRAVMLDDTSSIQPGGQKNGESHV